MDGLTVMDMAIGMTCFVAAFIAVLGGIFLLVKGSLDQKKTVWIPAVIILVLGAVCILAGLHFVRI